MMTGVLVAKITLGVLAGVCTYYFPIFLIEYYIIEGDDPWKFRLVKMHDAYTIQYTKKGLRWVTLTHSEHYDKLLQYFDADRSPSNLYFTTQVEPAQRFIDDFKLNQIQRVVDENIAQLRAKSPVEVIKGDDQ